MKGFPPCIEPVMKDVFAAMGVSAEEAAAMDPMGEVVKGIEVMENQMKTMCSTNAAGENCFKLAADMIGDQPANPTELCKTAESLGCCLGTLNNIMTESGAESITDADMCPDLVLPKPCVVADETRKIVLLKFAVKGIAFDKYSKLPEGKKALVRAALVKDIAKKLGISPAEVDLGLGQGDASGLAFTANVDANSKDEAAVIEAFSGDLELTETKAALKSALEAEGDTSTDVDNVVSADVKAETSEIDGGTLDEPIDSGAASLTPALVLAASLAALAL
jgi:hypothetical protein